MFERNSEFAVDNIKLALVDIENYGSSFRDNVKYIDKMDLFKAFTNDKILGIYAVNFVIKEITKINTAEMNKKIEQSKQIEAQISSEPVTKIKSHDFEMGD